MSDLASTHLWVFFSSLVAEITISVSTQCVIVDYLALFAIQMVLSEQLEFRLLFPNLDKISPWSLSVGVANFRVSIRVGYLLVGLSTFITALQKGTCMYDR
ncbi:hypothetical protein B0J12DRAFT_223422 [Macrophomina phaseolina]|uniref:Uncharacterized protein n=1 Tax=Macrophomina phaseolina TaxID=35725 RepID=A0ABQ8G0T9_9PEZI|nr:hypothetical protein B0J12DRAFT_223422 [Macrophomina phaseolina]